MKTYERYIFTDLDGVLTSTHETPGSYINHDDDEYGLSMGCVKRLIKLAEETHSKVVISSNWRKFPNDGYWHHPRGDFKNHMPELIELLGTLYAGALPKDRHLVKSEALALWFEQRSMCPNDISYVVFDDDKRELFQESEFRTHFILTDSEWGLTENNI